MKRNKYTLGKLVSYNPSEMLLPVKCGLAYTPADMMAMAERGIPISTQNMDGQFNDGETNPSWSVPLDQVRGIDPAELWQARMSITGRVRKAHKNDRQKYGDESKS